MARPIQLPSGQWRARIWNPETKRYTSLGTFSTERDAERAQLKKELGIEDEPPAPKEILRGPIKFQRYSEDLLTARKPVLASGTWHLYTWALQKHLIPSFGHRKLTDITPSMVRSWWAGMPEGSARKTAYVLLSSIMNQAVEDGEIAKSPVRIKGAGQDVSQQRPTFHIADVTMLIEMSNDAQLRTMLRLLLASGMRVGEALGLNRGDVDADQGTVTVQRHLTRHELASGTKAHRHAVRVLSVSESAMEALQQHLDATTGSPATPLFQDSRGNRMSYHALNKRWAALRASVGLDDMHIHDIRHVHLSEYSRHASLQDVQARAGQKDLRATMRYLHTSLERDREIVKAMSL